MTAVCARAATQGMHVAEVAAELVRLCKAWSPGSEIRCGVGGRGSTAAAVRRATTGLALLLCEGGEETLVGAAGNTGAVEALAALSAAGE
jgi:hypothetical protein